MFISKPDMRGRVRREGIQYFFSQIDLDNSGVNDNEEFIDDISKVQAEISSV